MPTYASHLKPFGTTIFTVVNQLAKQYNAINLGQGSPDYDGPPEVLEEAMQSILDGRANQYAPGSGIQPLRESVRDYVGHYYNLDLDAEQGVVVTSGASEGLSASLAGVLHPGDEVILLEPFFDIYKQQIVMSGAKPIYVPMYPPEWKFDPEELRRAFNVNTRAIVINTPNNPTGRVLTLDELTIIADLCKEFDALAIADEVYEFLVYDDNQHIPIATLPGMFERTLTISSAAKTFSVTGWKVGWVYGHPDLVAGPARAHQAITFSVNHPGQYGVARGFQLGDSYFQELKETYATKRAKIMDALAETPLKALPSQGTFFVMADYSDVFDGADEDFSKLLIVDYGVATIPPSSFYSEEHQSIGGKHIRFSFCKQDDIFAEVGRRLARLEA